MGLRAFLRNPSIWVFLLHGFKDLVSNTHHILLAKRSRRCHPQEFINDALQNAEPKFGVDDRISEVNASNHKTHGRLLGCGISDWVRLECSEGFRVFFIKHGGNQ